jgi:hypothetical protein
MKVECPECKALAEPSWMRGRADGQFEVKCGACGVVSVAASTAVAPAPVAQADCTVVCPKCSHRQQNPESCDRCGLVFARWDPDRALAESDEAARALWDAIDRGWDEEARHGAFLEYCTGQGFYAFAAQQYGQARREVARRVRADVQLGRLVLVAEQALAAAQPPDRSGDVRRFKRVVLMVAIVLCVSMLAFVLSRFLR